MSFNVMTLRAKHSPDKNFIEVMGTVTQAADNGRGASVAAARLGCYSTCQKDSICFR